MALLVAVSVPLVFGGPARADLLVTRDGSVVETDGPWRVHGRLVIFTLPDGQLASLQLGEVDLEASQAATQQREAASEEPPAPEEPERTAVMVLTDSDVRRAPGTDGGTEEAGDESAEVSDRTAEAERLVIGTWEEASEADGLVITGELVNQSPDVAADIELAVLLYDGEGELLRSALATLTSHVLQPGQRAGFRAEAQGVFDYSAMRFEAQSLGLATGAVEQSPGDEG